MSPRAACRLATLGFPRIFDYLPGKVDWLARNLPVDGSRADAPTIGRHLRHEVVTVAPDEPIAEVRARVADSPHGFALVTTADGILLGRLRVAHLDAADPRTSAAEAMEAGPSTLRPHQPAAPVRDRLRGKGRTYAMVTDPDGRLLRTVHAADLP
jgi:CBS domain-containing protein